MIVSKGRRVNECNRTAALMHSFNQPSTALADSSTTMNNTLPFAFHYQPRPTIPICYLSSFVLCMFVVRVVCEFVGAAIPWLGSGHRRN